ncbi:proline-rich receptor-like protein kinase PERK9 [Durio zibethinus]|uniref:non-specific serine/threonine protein kinase n=1 Tax=Durio zibethinus TaxID=66656 RepID=A0A6P6BJ83_DURZI|nr:proline-rich receptor-like protein kinase PERK9 [Durio zibethinus]
MISCLQENTMAVTCLIQLILSLINFPFFLHAVETEYASAELPSTWINNDFISRGSVDFVDGSTIRSILLNTGNPANFPAFGCGFYGRRATNAFYFAVFAVEATSDSAIIQSGSPQILWIANRDDPVTENATLEFKEDGNLVLSDADGMFVWSSNTSNSSVNYMNITGNGTLKLVYSETGSFSIPIWQSLDYPIDTWLPNQRIRQGQKLIASVSASNWTPGQFYLSFANEKLYAFIQSSPPQTYHEVFAEGEESKQFKTGRLELEYTSQTIAARYTPDTENFQFLRLDTDGHLRAYQWFKGNASAVADILTDKHGKCAYPTVCGNYGICTKEQCSCPVGNNGDTSYFMNSSTGCRRVTPLFCQSSHLHSFIELPNVSYFGFVAAILDTSIESCKQACLRNCSCKAALFHYNSKNMSGNCSLPSQIFSLMSTSPVLFPYNSTSFIKVQRSTLVLSGPPSPPSPPSSTLYLSSPPSPSPPSSSFIKVQISPLVLSSPPSPSPPPPPPSPPPPPPSPPSSTSYITTPPSPSPPRSTLFPSSPPSLSPPLVRSPSPPSAKKKSIRIELIIVLVVAALIVTFILILACVRILRKRGSRKKEGRKKTEDDWEKSLNLVTYLPTRFHYEDLKSATENFNKRIGGGGFGSVFEGTLRDGTKIAVKRLDRVGQGRKEFLAEVKTIGSIHHVNLVRLIGFCIESSNTLLVYEHMTNGSLDEWIFNKSSTTTPKWEIRKKIILDIAKGLAYLHEDCQMRIAHLDVKPENILLDDSFNAKLSDFGLARPIDRSQSHVITQMRGTRGYLAPEWLTGRITEKVDVYSFGVVILEVVCGRRNLDFSRPDEDDYLLLPILKQKAEQNQLFDMVNHCIEGIRQNAEEAVKMIRIAIWCLQSDYNRRPSMSMVCKVLEGLLTMEPVSDYSFLTSTVVEAPAEVIMVPSSPQPASVLSGPR